MTSIEDQLAITATHEAGHCSAYFHFNWRFRRVRIWPENGQVRGSGLSPDGRYNCFERGIMCLAGPIAELKLTGVGLEQQTGSWRDIEMAKEALSKVDFADRLGIESVLPFTHLMIDHSWPCIQLLSSHLIDRRELGYDEVLELIQAA
jgi:hypothetical protein